MKTLQDYMEKIEAEKDKPGVAKEKEFKKLADLHLKLEKAEDFGEPTDITRLKKEIRDMRNEFKKAPFNYSTGEINKILGKYIDTENW